MPCVGEWFDALERLNNWQTIHSDDLGADLQPDRAAGELAGQAIDSRPAIVQHLRPNSNAARRQHEWRYQARIVDADMPVGK